MGASQSVGIIGHIAANLIGFVALLAFVNNSLVWFGERVGMDGFTFEVCMSTYIHSWLFVL